jgi:indole-3-glycerol phosphate synthase
VKAGPRIQAAAPQGATGAGDGAAPGPATLGTAGGTYLDRIVPAVRRRLEERKRVVPLAELQALPSPGARPGLATALAAPGVSLIAEVKRASPSKGPIRPDLDVGALAKTYERAGASAVSVLTEQDHFGGSLDDLRTAAAGTRLPLLCKDFIVDGYQIHEARALGASAVLLIAALLDDSALRDLAGVAASLGLDVLLEVHDEAEMARALTIDGAVIGVNNRDLRSFTVSLETTERLAALVPAGRLLVGESGIRDHVDVARLAAVGVDGVLVGESILRCSDVGAAIRALLEPSPAVGVRTGGHT